MKRGKNLTTGFDVEKADFENGQSKPTFAEACSIEGIFFLFYPLWN